MALMTTAKVRGNGGASVRGGAGRGTEAAAGAGNRKLGAALWTAQGLLALVFLFAGSMKLVMPVEEMTHTVAEHYERMTAKPSS